MESIMWLINEILFSFYFENQVQLISACALYLHKYGSFILMFPYFRYKHFSD
jgi:hypothetical protein